LSSAGKFENTRDLLGDLFGAKNAGVTGGGRRAVRVRPPGRRATIRPCTDASGWAAPSRQSPSHKLFGLPPPAQVSVEVREATPVAADVPSRCGRSHQPTPRQDAGGRTPRCRVSMAGRPSSPRAMARPPSAQLNACDPSLVVKLPLVVTPLSSTANLWWQTTSDVRSRAPGSLSQTWRLAPFGSDYFKPGLVEPSDPWWYRVTNTPELLTSNDHTHAKDDCNLIHSFRLPAYLFLPNNGRYNSCSC
jgi:hypothetical protein